MTLVYGKPVAERILAETKERITRSDIVPGLAVILAGDYIESHKYVGLKEARAQEVGIHFEKILFPTTVSQVELFQAIETLNGRDDIHGIIVQLPLPSGLLTDEIISHIDPKKDTDGFHEETLQRFLSGDSTACPVFPRAIVELIRETKVTFQGERGIALVNSDLMGKVMAFALSLEGLEAEYVLGSAGHVAIAEKTKTARVVVTACGIPDLLTADIVSSDAIVIDGGNVHVNDKVQGDVKREEVEEKAAFLSPVPGGVGPVTVATLLSRVTAAALTKKG
jgi:methylenetetrahydrofolate dehydrogenase (NADP+)/methenyltetrahydrofolate cyclohydrolase